METPRSVQVFSREMIDDLDPAAIEDIVTRSANVVFLGDNDGRENTFIIRGFERWRRCCATASAWRASGASWIRRSTGWSASRC